MSPPVRKPALPGLRAGWLAPRRQRMVFLGKRLLADPQPLLNLRALRAPTRRRKQTSSFPHRRLCGAGHRRSGAVHKNTRLFPEPRERQQGYLRSTKGWHPGAAAQGAAFLRAVHAFRGWCLKLTPVIAELH